MNFMLIVSSRFVKKEIQKVYTKKLVQVNWSSLLVWVTVMNHQKKL